MQVIVLNADMSFLNKTTVQRAHILLYIKKRAIGINNAAKYVLHGFNRDYVIPAVIKLKDYVSRKLKEVVPPWKINVFIRDRFTCCYCGRKLSRGECTLDHVLPRSRGGKDEWTNLVTACKGCNTYKGNDTPKEAYMEMRFKPYQPSSYEFFQLQLEAWGIKECIDEVVNSECGIK